MSTLVDDVNLVLDLAEEADSLTMPRFGAVDLRIDTKPDMTPATDADLDAETMLRGRLAEQRPGDSVLGEEFGGTTAFSGRQWVIDPIDGTKSFVRGVPVWATLIALLVDGVPVVGVVSAPALGRRWWAAQGQGAFTSFGGATRRAGPGSSISPTRCGGCAATATSGRTAWWPRVPSTSRWSRRSSCGISRRWTSWCAKPAAGSRIWQPSRGPTAAARWRQTGCCTTRCWLGWLPPDGTAHLTSAIRVRRA
jgi:fructose-1,6-bisphosphatase/inositol monophosphatase family enzyme